jgi:hypothetical protein
MEAVSFASDMVAINLLCKKIKWGTPKNAPKKGLEYHTGGPLNPLNKERGPLKAPLTQKKCLLIKKD